MSIHPPVGGAPHRRRRLTARTATFLGAGVAALLIFSACSPAAATSTAPGAAAALSAVKAGTVSGTITTSDPAYPIGAGGAGVDLYSTEGEQPMLYSAKVGSGGAFTLRNVAPGRYKVHFSGGSQFADEWYDNAGSQDAAKTITVSASRATDHIDAELMATPTGELMGNLYLDPHSQNTRGSTPVPEQGVEVRVYKAIGDSEDYQSTVTNAEGHYSFGALPIGQYKVRFMGRESAPQLDEEWFGDSFTRLNADSVQVERGRTTQADADVAPPPFSVQGAGKITGQARVGSTLTADTGVWVPTPDSYQYFWLKDGNERDGVVGTGSSYTLTPADAGHTITLRIEAILENPARDGYLFSRPVYLNTPVVEP